MGSTPTPDVRPDVPPGGHDAHAAHVPTAEDFRETQASPEFQELRSTHRGFVFPMTVVFLVWYFVYVILAAYFPVFMSIRLWGYINVGLVLGLLQFVSTFAITAAYVHFANKKLDPKATAIRLRLEGAQEGDAK